jgi:aquaporin Z
MTVSFDQPLGLLIGLGLLVINVVSLFALLCLRPATPRFREDFADFSRGLRSCLAEGVGTFALLYFGLLSVLASADGAQNTSHLLLIAAVHGGILATLVAALGPISGAQFNPGLTLAMLLTGKVGFVRGLFHLLAQGAGTILAMLLLTMMFDAEKMGAVVPGPSSAMTLRGVFILEAVATMILTIVIFGAGREHPWAVGLTLSVAILATGPLTGAALNPLRYLGPALVTQNLDAWIAYLTAPPIGAVIGGVLMRYFLLEDRAEDTDTQAPAERDRRQAA